MRINRRSKTDFVSLSNFVPVRISLVRSFEKTFKTSLIDALEGTYERQLYSRRPDSSASRLVLLRPDLLPRRAPSRLDPLVVFSGFGFEILNLV